MAEGLMARLTSPDALQYLAGVGAGLSRADAGRGFDISATNQQYIQTQQNNAAREKLKGLMGQFGLNPQQRELVGQLPVEMQQQVLADQAFPQQGKTPADMQKLEWIRQNYPEEYEQARRIMFGLEARAGSGPVVNVNTGSNMPQVGTIPQGYELRQTPSGWQMAPIEGGPAALERDQAAIAAASAGESKAMQGGVVLEDIGRIKDIIEKSTLPVTGFVGSRLKKIEGTNAYDVSALTSTIASNIGFDKLQRMRAESPTGGALGNVSEKEIAFLQATLGSLDQSQSEEQFLRNLSRLEQIYNSIMTKAAAYPNAAAYGFGGGASAPAGGGFTETKAIGGKTYGKRNGKWYEVK